MTLVSRSFQACTVTNEDSRNQFCSQRLGVFVYYEESKPLEEIGR